MPAPDAFMSANVFDQVAARTPEGVGHPIALVPPLILDPEEQDALVAADYDARMALMAPGVRASLSTNTVYRYARHLEIGREPADINLLYDLVTAAVLVDDEPALESALRQMPPLTPDTDVSRWHELLCMACRVATPPVLHLLCDHAPPPVLHQVHGRPPWTGAPLRHAVQAQNQPNIMVLIERGVHVREKNPYPGATVAAGAVAALEKNTPLYLSILLIPGGHTVLDEAIVALGIGLSDRARINGAVAMLAQAVRLWGERRVKRMHVGDTPVRLAGPPRS